MSAEWILGIAATVGIVLAIVLWCGLGYLVPLLFDRELLAEAWKKFRSKLLDDQYHGDPFGDFDTKDKDNVVNR